MIGFSLSRYLNNSTQQVYKYHSKKIKFFKKKNRLKHRNVETDENIV